MKRKIIDIFIDINKGNGIFKALNTDCYIFPDKIRDENGKLKKDENGKTINSYHLVINPTAEIEDKWEEKPVNDKGIKNKIGLIFYQDKEKATEESIQADKEKIFWGIIYRLLISNMKPIGNAHIWVEEQEDKVFVKGVCLIDEKEHERYKSIHV